MAARIWFARLVKRDNELNEIVGARPKPKAGSCRRRIDNRYRQLDLQQAVIAASRMTLPVVLMPKFAGGNPNLAFESNVQIVRTVEAGHFGDFF